MRVRFFGEDSLADVVRRLSLSESARIAGDRPASASIGLDRVSIERIGQDRDASTR
jgi:hypothetical protein